MISPKVSAIGRKIPVGEPLRRLAPNDVNDAIDYASHSRFMAKETVRRRSGRPTHKLLAQ